MTRMFFYIKWTSSFQNDKLLLVHKVDEFIPGGWIITSP